MARLLQQVKTMRLGDISVSFVELMAKAVIAAGHCPNAILEQYHLDAVRLSSPYARISIPRFMRLGHEFIQEFKLPWLGLAMGRACTAPALGLAGLVAESAVDIRQACVALARFELLNSFNARGHSSFYLEQQHGVLEFYSISPYNAYNYFVVDSVLAGWKQMLEQLNKTKLVARVEFEFNDPGYKEHYAKLFNTELRFGAERNALIFKPDALEQPVCSANASTHAMLLQIAEQDLERVRLGLSFRERVERTIGTLLNGTTPSIDDVANTLNTTAWIIRRRLQAEGVNFQQVLNATRKDLAMSYIKDTGLSLGEIAYLLGFGSSVAFQRAFKRWTGEPPGQYAQRVREN